MEDVERIKVIVNKAFREEGGWTGEAHLIRGDRVDVPEITQLLQDQNNRVIVCEKLIDGGWVMVGSVIATKEDDEEGSVNMLSVEPVHQSGGVGSTLLKAAMDALKKDFHLKRVFITVIHSRTELIAWYKKIGFQETGETKEFPLHLSVGKPIVPDVHFNLMKKDL